MAQRLFSGAVVAIVMAGFLIRLGDFLVSCRVVWPFCSL